MLTHDLYYIFKLLSCSYDNINTIYKNSTCIFNEKLLDYLHLKKFFISEWLKKSSLNIVKNSFSYTYNILETTSEYVKIKFNIFHYFYIKDKFKYIKSGINNELILILETSTLHSKLLFLVFKEENTKLYNFLMQNSFNPLTDINFSLEINSWLDKINSLDSIYNKFLSFINKNHPIENRNSKFDIDAACSYAEAFALTPNPEYKDFTKTGGDCTNFISQIVHSGGIKTSSSWQPYSNSWIRVEELYSYLISNNIGHPLPKNFGLSRGGIIQFYKPSVGRYFHSGFITYELENKDYLYCCHTYNKLNYPLSAIYPVIYPTLRAVKL